MEAVGALTQGLAGVGAARLKKKNCRTIRRGDAEGQTEGVQKMETPHRLTYPQTHSDRLRGEFLQVSEAVRGGGGTQKTNRTLLVAGDVEVISWAEIW